MQDDADVPSENPESLTHIMSRNQEQPMTKDASNGSHALTASTAPAEDEDIWDVPTTKKSKKNKKNKKTKALDDPFTAQERELELGESNTSLPVADLEDVNRRVESDTFMQAERDAEAGHAVIRENKHSDENIPGLDQQDQAFLDTEREIEEGVLDYKSGIAVQEELEHQTSAEKSLHDEAVLEEDNTFKQDISGVNDQAIPSRLDSEHVIETSSNKQAKHATIADENTQATEDKTTDVLAPEQAPASSPANADPEELDKWQSSQSHKQSKKNKKKNKKALLAWDEETPAADESSKIVTPSFEKKSDASEEVANMAVIATEAMAVPVIADQKTEDVSTAAEEPKATLDEDASFTLTTKKGKKGKKAKKQQKLDLWSDATDSVEDTALSKSTLQRPVQEKFENEDGAAGDKQVQLPQDASDSVRQIHVDKAHQPSVSEEADEPSLNTIDDKESHPDNVKTTQDHAASIHDSYDETTDKSSNEVQADRQLVATDEVLESSATDNDPFATSNEGAEHTPGEAQLLHPVVSKLPAVTPDVVEVHSAQQSEDIEPRYRGENDIAAEKTIVETPGDKDPFETTVEAAEHTPGETQLLQPVSSKLPGVASDDIDERAAQQSQDMEPRDRDEHQIAANRAIIGAPIDKDPFELTKEAAEHTPGEAQLTGTPQYQLLDETTNHESGKSAPEATTPQPEEENEFSAWPVKKSKKDKKKAKKAAAVKWTEPEAEEETSSKENKIGEAAIGTAAIAATAAATASLQEPQKEQEQQDDIWDELPKKQTKKDKRKAKKAAALAMFEEQPVPTPGPTTAAETHDDKAYHHEAAELQDEPTLKQRPIDDHLDGRESATPQLQEEEAQNIPLPVDDVDDWTESHDHATQASKSSTKAIGEADQHVNDSLEDKSREDLEFAATLAAGLAGTGFDPNLVANDPVFHRRSSPSERSAEADPEEAEFKPYVRRRRSREQSPPDTKEAMKEEVSQADREHNTADDDFSAAITRGLEASGFDAAALHSTADISKDTSLSERDNDMEELSWSTKRQKKGKKNKRQDQSKAEDVQHEPGHTEPHVPDSWDDFAEDRQMPEAPAAEQLNAEEDKRDVESTSANRDADNIVAADEDIPSDWAITTKKSKKGKKGKKSAATAASSGTSTPLAIKTEDVFTESAPIMKDEPIAEGSMTSDAANLMGGDREMDVDEMDKAYKAYKKNKRKAKKDKYAAASSTSTATTPAQIEEPDLDTIQHTPTRQQHEEYTARSASEHERNAEQDTPHHEMEQKTNVSNILAVGLATTGVAAIAGGALTHSRKHDNDEEYRSSHDHDDTTPSKREIDHHNADWSFSALDDDNNQSNANNSFSKSIAEETEHQQPVLHPTASKESLSSRRSLDPLHVDVKQENEGIRLPKRGDRKTERNTPQSRTSSSETPLEPTSRNRGSHLFQSTPITTPEHKNAFLESR
ncbi:hypothetical protein MRB53_041234 [Persea americana]|nr:hypothetical protein MRB53_041234 [Persea americana]